MAKNDNITGLDTAQALKKVIDSEHDSIRVVQALNTEMFINLSAEDADSVESVARFQSITQADGEVDCSRMRRMCVYGSGTVEISPNGDDYFNYNPNGLIVLEICAMKIKITGSGTIFLQS